MGIASPLVHLLVVVLAVFLIGSTLAYAVFWWRYRRYVTRAEESYARIVRELGADLDWREDDE